jgi:hypothetical protein
MYEIMMPDGALFQAIMNDPSYSAHSAKYAVPLHSIPAPTRRLLETNQQHRVLATVFRTKRADSQGFISLSLHEEFFMHFCLYQINPPSTRVSSAMRRLQRLDRRASKYTAEEHYELLLIYYLKLFFPHGDGRIGSGSGNSNGNSSGSRSGNGNGTNSRSNNINDLVPTSRPSPLSIHASTFLQMIGEFWLAQNAIDPLYIGERFIMPTGSLIASISRVMKHMYTDPKLPSMNCMSRPMQMLQPYFFQFFRAAFSRWPPHKMHRLPEVIRLWLKYLQPWVDNGDPKKRRSKPVPYTSTWKSYIVQNFAFYSIVLTDFLYASRQVNFGSMRNVSYAIRVFELFNSIKTEMQECEMRIKSSPHGEEYSETGILRAHLADFAGITYDQYVPIFGSPLEDAALLIVHIRRSCRHYVAERRREFQAHQRFKKRESWSSCCGPLRNPFKCSRSTWNLNSLADWFTLPGRGRKHRSSTTTSSSSRSSNSAHSRLGSMTKAQHEKSVKKDNADFTKLSSLVVRLFDIPERVLENLQQREDPDYMYQGEVELDPDMTHNDSLMRLTDAGRSQVRKGMRVCSNMDVPFNGDIWDRPQASHEFRWLLSASHWMSESLNKLIYGSCREPGCSKAVAGRAIVLQTSHGWELTEPTDHDSKQHRFTDDADDWEAEWDDEFESDDDNTGANDHDVGNDSKRDMKHDDDDDDDNPVDSSMHDDSVFDDVMNPLNDSDIVDDSLQLLPKHKSTSRSTSGLRSRMRDIHEDEDEDTVDGDIIHGRDRLLSPQQQPRTPHGGKSSKKQQRGARVRQGRCYWHGGFQYPNHWRVNLRFLASWRAIVWIVLLYWILKGMLM